MKKYFILFLTAALFASCNDWLDVTPKDKKLEEDIFSSEDEINTVTNGLYREMVGENLYGGKLSQTTVEVMGHVYTYSPGETSSDSHILTLWSLANFKYERNETLKKVFADIWGSAYTAALHINTYIKKLDETPAVMLEKNKKILLGEAYGMRAYIHFDLFRLFGPAWQDKDNSRKILPYHNKPEVTMNHTGYEETEYSTADEYMTLLLEDIAAAENLLKDNDPVIDAENSITNRLADNFYLNRNRRMNYYAVKGLEARVRQYRGELELAAAAAQVITDQMGKRFKWATSNLVASRNNYIFFSEVIFGINNLEMVSRGKNWYGATELRKAYVIDRDNLLDNILGYSGSALESIIDIRSKQWTASDVDNYTNTNYSTLGSYKSKKYNTFTFSTDTTDNTYIPAIKDLQVLMRISEMFYIQAEAALKAGDRAKAIELLNTVLRNRGLTVQYFLTPNISESELQAHIIKEYYREFIGEGQIFFFHKRRGSTEMFKGYGTGTDPVLDFPTAFVVPIPEKERNI